MAGLDLPVEVTTGGAIFIAIVIIVALAAWNTGNNSAVSRFRASLFDVVGGMGCGQNVTARPGCLSSLSLIIFLPANLLR